MGKADGLITDKKSPFFHLERATTDVGLSQASIIHCLECRSGPDSPRVSAGKRGFVLLMQEPEPFCRLHCADMILPMSAASTPNRHQFQF